MNHSELQKNCNTLSCVLFGNFINSESDLLRLNCLRVLWSQTWELYYQLLCSNFLIAPFSIRQFSDVTDLDKAWTKLVNTLSGQFCASLNFLDTSQAISPEWSFQPRGLSPLGLNSSSVSGHFRHGTLPGENVCTENLTPWKKLLPCESKRGF